MTTTGSPDTAAADAKDLSRGLIGAAIAVCAWSSGTILAKYIDMGGLAIGFYRFAFFSVMMLLWMQARGTPFHLRVIRDSMWGGIALGADIALFFSAVKLTSIVNATIIGSMQPIVVGVIAARFFGEQIRRRDALWSLVALGGAVLVVATASGDDATDLRGDLLALAAMLAWSAYFIFSKGSKEVVGYLASLLVVLALTMTSIVRLRTLSLCGAVTFLVYGLLIGSVPIIVTNASIASINIWFLTKEFASGRSRGVELSASQISADSPFLADFLSFHLADIHKFQPDFRLPTGPDVLALILNRDGIPAGLLIGRRTGTTLTIDLDYVLRPYRDSRLGRWMYGSGADVFRAHGITEVRSAGTADAHRKYLERMGFHPSSTDADIWELNL